MEFIATMESAQSAMPANIEQAVALEIKESCLVPDVFRIVDDYPNIRHVKVAGQNYTSQEIKQMGIGQRLGVGSQRTEDPALAGIYEQLTQAIPTRVAEALNMDTMFDTLNEIARQRQRDQTRPVGYWNVQPYAELQAQAMRTQNATAGTTGNMVYYDELVTNEDAYF